MNEPSGPARKVAVVNGLRGVAILGVIWHHVFARYTPTGWKSVSVAGVALPVFAPLSNGWLGVDLFFVLSGFVLFLPYATGERVLRDAASVLDYWRRRFRRLMPLYWVNVIVAFALTSATDDEHFWADAAIMGSATFNWTERLYVPPYNIVLWSLGIEIWFSVIFPALVMLERRYGIRTLLAVALVLSLAMRVLGEWHYRPVWEMNPVLNPIKDSLAGRLDEFVVGMALAALLAAGYALAARGAVAACVLGVLAVWASSVLWDQVLLAQLPRALVPFINDLLLLGLFALVLGLLSVPARWKHAVTNAPLQIAGMMSYSLYLWHVLIVTRWFTTPADHRPFTYATYLLVTFGVAVLSYRYVEFRTTPWRLLFRPAAD